MISSVTAEGKVKVPLHAFADICYMHVFSSHAIVDQGDV